MRPDANTQIRWGLGASAAALGLILILAFVPDPFFRQRVVSTTFDNVAALSPGAPVYFRGSAIGSVRSVRLDPSTRTFAVRLGVSRDWRPSGCAFAQINETNPLSPPQIELVALEIAPAACPLARATAGCAVLPGAGRARGEAMAGCRRAPDFFQNASLAVAQITELARAANVMAGRLQAMVPDSGGADVKTLIGNATSTLVAANQLTRRLDDSLTPGKGDLALTLANARSASDQVARIDVASLNASIANMKTMLAENQQAITALISQGRDVTGDSKVLLENLSSSLTSSSANLQRATDNLDALTERLAADPAYALRGRKFSDPPTPKGSK